MAWNFNRLLSQQLLPRYCSLYTFILRYRAVKVAMNSKENMSGTERPQK